MKIPEAEVRECEECRNSLALNLFRRNCNKCRYCENGIKMPKRLTNIEFDNLNKTSNDKEELETDNSQSEIKKNNI